MEIENEINNNIKVEKEQNEFFNTMIGGVVNNAMDIGLRTILPDIIEDQIIDIKNEILENGVKEGIQTAVNSVKDFAKSAIGLTTGKFDNMAQVELAIKNGGIADTISDLLDVALDKTFQLGYTDKTVTSLIRNGKNIILNNLTNNIKNEMNYQTNSLEKMDRYINNWKNYYENKDFEGMTKEMTKIKSQLKNIIPLENTIKEARKVETLHNLIKNNGQNFEITKLENELVEKLS